MQFVQRCVVVVEDVGDGWWGESKRLITVVSRLFVGCIGDEFSGVRM